MRVPAIDLRLKDLLAVVALVATEDLELGLVTILLLLRNVVGVELIKHGLGRITPRGPAVRTEDD